MAASQPTAGERHPPDPAWRRRALLTGLLFVALSEPQFPVHRTAVTLWIDDSYSMLTREAQGTRLAEGLAQARSLLSELAHADVEVRTLGDPWHNLGALTEATVATVSTGVGQRAPRPPPAALLRRDSLHWLVTDGAHAALFDWPNGGRPDRTIQVASITRNAGLERLSARRNLTDPERVDLLLKATNGGTAVETRVIVFATDAGDVTRSTQRLDPGSSALVTASIPASASVRARLQPGDALTEDDEIVLDLAPLRRRRVALDSTCPGALVAAVAIHPALAPAPSGATDIEAAVDCGARGVAASVATIRVLADRTPTRPLGPVQWSSAMGGSRRIGLDAGLLQLAAQLRARPADTVLLAVGGEPVIVSRAGASKLLETSLDFSAAGFTRSPEIPLLVSLMFDHLLGGRLLDETVITDRGPAAAKVAPAVRASPIAGDHVRSDVPMRQDWTRPLLMVALLAMLWEIAALGRQWARLRAYAGAEPE